MDGFFFLFLFFFPSCFPSCLPKKNALGARRSCACITGAAPASKQVTKRKKKRKKSDQTLESVAIHRRHQQLSPAALARPSLDLQSGTWSAARRQIISAAQNDVAELRPGVVTNAAAAGTAGGEKATF